MEDGSRDSGDIGDPSPGPGLSKRALAPIVVSGASAAALHALHVLHVLGFVPSPVVITAMLLPLLAFELAATVWLAGWRWRDALAPRRAAVLGLTAAFWVGAFYVWVIRFAEIARIGSWLRWFGPQFYIQLALVYRAEGWLTGVAVVVCLALYVAVTVRRGRLRLVTTLVAPTVASTALFFHLALWGGSGGMALRPIDAQPGVTRVFQISDLAAAGYREGAPEPLRCTESRAQPLAQLADTSLVDHPRGICVEPDGSALVAAYGCTWCYDDADYPTLVRVDLRGGPLTCFKSRNVRQIDCPVDSGEVLVAPWVDETVYVLSRDDLSVEARIPAASQGRLEVWEPMDVLLDIARERIYVGNDIEQAISAYDRIHGRYLGDLNLYRRDLVGWGGPVFMMIQARSTGLLYLTTGPGENLMEVDPYALELRRSLRLGDIIGTALVLDEEGGHLYYQCGLTDPLYRIDLGRFQVDRVYRGEAHARRLVLDRRRGALYVLGHFSGQLFALDLDTGERRWEVAVGGRPGGLAMSQDALWVNSFAGVHRVELETVWAAAGYPDEGFGPRPVGPPPATRGR